MDEQVEGQTPVTMLYLGKRELAAFIAGCMTLSYFAFRAGRWVQDWSVDKEVLNRSK